MTIVVPNRNIETWLKFGLAERDGIAANLSTPFLRVWLGAVARAARPGARVLGAALTEGLLLDLLHDESFTSGREMAPVGRWLTAGTGDPDDVDRRRCQLAARLARTFEEYTYSRREMLRLWDRDKAVPLPGFEEAETWQRHLWRALRRKVADVAGGIEPPESWIPAPELFESLSTGQLRAVLPPAVHVFGLSYMARAFLEVLGRLAEATDLCVYTLNPCREFWEDVQTEPERRRLKDRLASRRKKAGLRWIEEETPGEEDPFGLLDPDDTPALVLWGRPGRENVRLLNELSDCDFDADFEDPVRDGRPTLLTLLQRDILDRCPRRTSPVSEGTGLATDRSLVVVAASALSRECEAIASEVWKRVREAASLRRPLRFNEIAVILPSSRAAEYQAHLPAAFDGIYGIPHHVVDLPASRESRVVEAAAGILALPFSHFTRPEVLSLATHPNVIGRFPGAVVDDWSAWTAATAILHGADHGDHAGTYIDRDLFSWDQGLRRLALGAFLPGRRSGGTRTLRTPEGEYLPEETASDLLGSATAFSLLVRSLVSDARWLRAERRPLPWWSEALTRLLSTYVVPLSDADEAALLRCLESVGGLGEVPLSRDVSFRVAFELASARLAALPGTRRGYLADGVVVSTFLPMRAIPFRHIFVAGLNEGDFPSGERRDVLDLRTGRRRAGDVSPREQDRYMFLEALLSARESFTLSYVRRDALTGEELSPSSVVAELRQMLEPALGSWDRLVLRPPLRRWSDPMEDGCDDDSQAVLPPEAHRERQARLLRESLEAHLGRSGALPALDEVRASLAGEKRSRVESLLGIVRLEIGKARPKGEREALTISLAQLRRFLECPMQGSATARLSLREVTADGVSSERDEVLSTNRFVRKKLLETAFASALREAVPPPRTLLDSRLAELASEGAASGSVPIGPFREAEQRNDLRILEGWAAALAELGGERQSLWKARFGAAPEGDDADVSRPPLELGSTRLADGREVTIRLVGATGWLEGELPGSSSVRLANEPSSGRRVPRVRMLGPFVDHLVLSAAGLAGDADRVAWELSPATGLVPVPLLALGREAARDALLSIAAECLGLPHDYYLPFEAILRWEKEGGAMPLATVTRLVRDAAGNRVQLLSDYGPVPLPRSRPLPDTEEARRALARFDLFHRLVPPAAGGAGV